MTQQEFFNRYKYNIQIKKSKIIINLMIKSVKAIILIAVFSLSTLQIWAQQNKESSTKTKKLILTLKLDAQMVEIDSGSFLMGSKKGLEDTKPPHQVTVNGLKMSKYEITIEQYLLFINEAGVDSLGYHIGVCYVDISDESSPIKYEDGEFIFRKTHLAHSEKYPMTEVSWYGAYAFCHFLNENTQRHFRLPTETEWEYACRAGTETSFYTGECITSDQANIDGTKAKKPCPKSGWLKRPIQGGSYEPNEWGLYNMHGNIAEWCLNTYEPYPGNENKRNQYFEENEIRKVFRGGFWMSNATGSSSSVRYKEYPQETKDYIGFRVVESIQ